MEGRPMEEFYGIDITEIDGFDNLHKPETILRESMKKTAELFGAEESFFLINGSTCGILTALSTVLRRGEILLLARNSHKAAYHGAYLNGLKTEYLYPCLIEEFGIAGGISKEEVKKSLEENPEIKAVFITSPTYDGVVSDVESIAALCHEKGIPLIVDEAHGAHFSFYKEFPKGALACGADLVIHSIHKTLPALTQTALLHVQGKRIEKDRLYRFLKIYQSSSPSYILMSGIEQCVMIMEREGKNLCRTFFENDACFMEATKKLKCLRIFKPSEKEQKKWGMKGFDRGKLIISCKGTSLSGKQLSQILMKSYHLQMEMAFFDYVTAIVTIMDTKEGWERLAKALVDIDARLEAEDGFLTETKKPYFFKKQAQEKKPYTSERLEKAMSIAEALDRDTEIIFLNEAKDKVAGEFVDVYPPGIPLIVPGERYSRELIEQLFSMKKQGLVIEGLIENEKTAKVRTLK